MSLPVDKKWLYQPFSLSRRTNPFLIIMMGLSGSGKSTVSRWLTFELQAAWLCSDVVRKRLYGLNPEQSSAESGLDIYSAGAHRRTFSQLTALTEKLLCSGYPVVIDSAALRSLDRQQFIALAKALNISFVIIYCMAREDTIKTRLHNRLQQPEEPSEATVKVMEQQKKWLEEPCAPEKPFLIRLNSDFPNWQGRLKEQLTPLRIC